MLLHDHGREFQTFFGRLGDVVVDLVRAGRLGGLRHEVEGLHHEGQVHVKVLEVRRLARAEDPHALHVVGVPLAQGGAAEGLGDVVGLVEVPQWVVVGLELDDAHGAGGGEHRQLLAKLEGLLEHVLPVVQLLRQARRQLVRLHRLAPQEHAERLARAHELGQRVARVVLGWPPALREAGAELRALGHEADVAGQGEAQAAAVARAVDARDDGLHHLPEAGEAADAPVRLCRHALSVSGELPLVARDHDDPRSSLGIQPVHDLEEVSIELRAPRILRLLRVQRHLHDAGFVEVHGQQVGVFPLVRLPLRLLLAARPVRREDLLRGRRQGLRAVKVAEFWCPVRREGGLSLLLLSTPCLLQALVNGLRFSQVPSEQAVDLLLGRGHGLGTGCRDLLGEGQGLLEDVLLGDGPLEQAGRHLLGRALVAGDEAEDRVARADQLRQDVRGGVARRQALPRDGRVQLRALGREADVAREGEAEASAATLAVERRDHRQAQEADLAEPRHLARGLGCPAALALAGYDHGAHRGVGIEPLEHLTHSLSFAQLQQHHAAPLRLRRRDLDPRHPGTAS
mmetsp:Transcript_38097/g.109937  ORF Transcript_38097/g.109937 Transcript_38097/m.109937 type:complete len:569 (+) Transcript_38097:1570-3276(+)